MKEVDINSFKSVTNQTNLTLQFKGHTSKQQTELAAKAHAAAFENAFSITDNAYKAFELATLDVMDDHGCISATCEVKISSGKIVVKMGADKEMSIVFRNAVSGKSYNTTNLIDKVDELIAAR